MTIREIKKMNTVERVREVVKMAHNKLITNYLLNPSSTEITVKTGYKFEEYEFFGRHPRTEIERITVEDDVEVFFDFKSSGLEITLRVKETEELEFSVEL